VSTAMAIISLLLLFDKGRIGFMGQHQRFFTRKLADELKGVARASLVSASRAFRLKPLRKSAHALCEKDRQRDHSGGGSQDPGLIGGIVTRIGDLVLDGSIKTQLLNMRETLKRGESV
jgi:F-type H+-transporting ATPase subunit delta